MLADSVKRTFSVIMLRINQKLLRGRKKGRTLSETKEGVGGERDKARTYGDEINRAMEINWHR